MRHLITFACLPAAYICYMFSFQIGVGILFAIGALLEILFWTRLAEHWPRRRPGRA